MRSQGRKAGRGWHFESCQGARPNRCSNAAFIVFSFRILICGAAAVEPAPWACSTTTWPVGGSTRTCAPNICNAVLGEVAGTVLDLNTGQKLYTHGGAYRPSELAIDDCCLLCRSTPRCNAWSYCNSPSGCGSKGACSSFVKQPSNQALGQAASEKVECTSDGRWRHTMCTLKHVAAAAAAPTSAAAAAPAPATAGVKLQVRSSTSTEQASMAGPRPSSTNSSSSSSSSSGDEGSATGWVSGVLSPVSSKPACADGLPHLVCSACAAAKNVAACHQCAAKYEAPASAVARDCAVCANLSTSALQSGCVDSIIKGNTGCILWQDPAAENQGQQLNMQLTEQCIKCSMKLGAMSYPCSACLAEDVSSAQCLDCVISAASQPQSQPSELVGCSVCNRKGFNSAACSKCLKFPSIAKDKYGYAAEACGACATAAMQSVPSVAQQCWACVQKTPSTSCGMLLSQTTEKGMVAPTAAVAPSFYACLAATKGGSTACSSCLMQSPPAGAQASAADAMQQQSSAMNQCLNCVTNLKGAAAGNSCRDCWLPGGKKGKQQSSKSCQECLMQVASKSREGAGSSCLAP